MGGGPTEPRQPVGYMRGNAFVQVKGAMQHFAATL